MDLTSLPGLHELWDQTTGADLVRVAILDGHVDRTHAAFAGSRFVKAVGAWPGDATDARMALHGTHVASVIFGAHDGPVPGIAPGCTAIAIPVFSDRSRVSQLDLARGIDAAIEAGAQLINISGGQRAECPEAEGWLDAAVRRCRDRNVLVIAAAGNDGCECLHVPAALPNVLAIGALGDDGRPLDQSNWGAPYATQGVLAPGERILGAVPHGGTTRLTGTSFAAPVVTGIAALLLSLQARRGEPLDPYRVRDLLLRTAVPCDATRERECTRFLFGTINVQGAHQAMSDVEISPSCGCQSAVVAAKPLDDRQGIVASQTLIPPVAPTTEQTGRLVYALGTLGYDFGTEARRDSFKQLMPPADVGGVLVPANPYDARQMVDYLAANPSESRSLIWTLNLELTPIYAIEPVGPFARDVYDMLRQILAAQVLAETDAEYVERVSIPGTLSGRSERLFSGQMVPVVQPLNLRGLYGWRINALVDAAVAAVRRRHSGDEETVRRALQGFLARLYFDLRNLGVTSQDRALNSAATNAFQAATTFGDAVAAGMELDSVGVERSPNCRADSDCWDVKLKFFDPENSRRAKRIYRYTIDVSDMIPVTMGEVRSWSSAE